MGRGRGRKAWLLATTTALVLSSGPPALALATSPVAGPAAATRAAAAPAADPPVWRGNVKTIERYQTDTDFAEQLTVYQLTAKSYTSEYRQSHEHTHPDCAPMLDHNEGTGEGSYESLDFYLADNGSNSLAYLVTDANHYHHGPMTSQVCGLDDQIPPNFVVSTSTAAGNMVVYPLASLSGCTQAIAEVPDNIQAIRTTSGGACNDTGFLLIDYQLRLNPCDPTVDSDGGGVGDCDEYAAGTDTLRPNDDGDPVDTDGDGRPDLLDNCVSVPNADQANLDGDIAGDVCDPDDDNDTLPDLQESVTDPRDWDTDDDLVHDGVDLCPTEPGDEQLQGCPDLGCDSPTVTERKYSIADGTASLPLPGLPDPDFGTFSLGVSWCIRSDGSARVDEVPVASAELSGNWVFLATLEELGFAPSVSRVSVGQGDIAVSATANYYVDFNAVEVAASLVPQGRLLDKVKDATRRYGDRVDDGMSKAKAARLFAAHVGKQLDKFNAKIQRQISKRLAVLPGVSDAFARHTAGYLTDRFGGAAKLYLAKLVARLGGVADEVGLFVKFFDVRAPVWKVAVTITPHAGGSHTVTYENFFYLLSDEWSDSVTP